MSFEAIQQISDIITINLLFHAALIGAVSLFAYHRLSVFIKSLPQPE
jgi:hypothetical protein|tara:strand:+ start:415 stop:555 length:141 start_codon:yes stop_codon:yes gene_type:complete